jgi:hypothetical protein
MRLSVATNFEPDLVAALKGYPVYELFGKLPADPLGGGRASYMLSPLSRRELAAHVRDARRHGICFFRRGMFWSLRTFLRPWTVNPMRLFPIRRLAIRAKAWCLRCHGEPKGEPDPMFPKYAKDGWKDGDLVGAAVARVAPMK